MDGLLLGTRDKYGVEVSAEFGMDGLWVVAVWHGGNGSSLGIPFADRAKADAVARYLYHTLEPEYAAEQERRRLNNERWRLEQKAGRWERQRRARERRERAKRAPKLVAFKCGQCGDLFRDGDQGEAVYECSRCGTCGVGDDGRRCQNCHVFAAKVADESCPHCEAALDEPEKVTAVDLDDGLVEV